jgi:hypothetical protein
MAGRIQQALWPAKTNDQLAILPTFSNDSKEDKNSAFSSRMVAKADVKQTQRSATPTVSSVIQKLPELREKDNKSVIQYPSRYAEIPLELKTKTCVLEMQLCSYKVRPLKQLHTTLLTKQSESELPWK